MASHPEFNETTTATEVASAFAGQIKGKNGKSSKYHIYILYHQKSIDYFV